MRYLAHKKGVFRHSYYEQNWRSSTIQNAWEESKICYWNHWNLDGLGLHGEFTEQGEQGDGSPCIS